MALGQGINDLLQYGSIAKAGQPQSLTGDALIELGALFTQMDFDFGEKEEEGSKFTKEFLDEKFKITDEALDKLDPFKNITTELLPGVKKLPKISKLNPRVKAEPKKVERKQENVVQDTANTVFPTVQSRTVNPTLVSGMTEGVEGYTVDLSNISQGAAPGSAAYVEGVSNADTVDLSEFDEYNEDGTLKTAQLADINEEVVEKALGHYKGKYDVPSSNAGRPTWVDKTNEAFKSLFNRFKDDSPIKRLQQEHPQVLQILQNLRYKQPSSVDSPLFRAAHIASSPFVKTDDVDYRMMKRATIPEYAQRLGGAAAAGYNIVVDKYNYEQAVKKDYEEELDDEMGDLNIEADTINENTRKDYLELAMGKKQKLNSLFQAYSKNEISKLDFENGKAALVSELNAVANAQSNLTKIRAEYLENKGTYHIDASKPEIVDFYNTLEKNPESFSMKTIDGIDYFIGQTNSGKEVKVPTSKIANGTAGFRLVEKVSVAPVVSGAVKAVGSYNEEGMTDYGFGVKSASPEKAKEIGVANIKSQLSLDENRLRSIMATIYGVNHSTYKNFIGNDPTANKEEMLNDAAEHLYETQVKPQFFPTQKTTRIDPSKVAFGGKTQRGSVAERNRAANIARLQKIGNITPGNFNSVESEIDLTKYSLVEEDGTYYVTDKKGNVLTQLNLSNQNETKSKLLNFMKGGGGIGQKSNQTESDPLGIN